MPWMTFLAARSTRLLHRRRVWWKVAAVSTSRVIFPLILGLMCATASAQEPAATPPAPAAQAEKARPAPPSPPPDQPDTPGKAPPPSPPTPPTPSAPAATAPAPPSAIPAFNIAPVEKTGTLPPDTSILAQKAATAFGEQNWAAARAAYQEMLELDAKNALAWANLGAVEQQAGNSQAALECFETSVGINPRLSQSWNAIGLIHSNKGDTYMAISAFSRAIHEEPTDARAHNYLAIAVKNLGWTDAAQAALMRAIELNPEYRTAHFNLALLYLDQKPPAIELARLHYQKAVALGAEKDEIVERRLKE